MAVTSLGHGNRFLYPRISLRFRQITTVYSPLFHRYAALTTYKIKFHLPPWAGSYPNITNINEKLSFRTLAPQTRNLDLIFFSFSATSVCTAALTLSLSLEDLASLLSAVLVYSYSCPTPSACWHQTVFPQCRSVCATRPSQPYPSSSIWRQSTAPTWINDHGLSHELHTAQFPFPNVLYPVQYSSKFSVNATSLKKALCPSVKLGGLLCSCLAIYTSLLPSVSLLVHCTSLWHMPTSWGQKACAVCALCANHTATSTWRVLSRECSQV